MSDFLSDRLKVTRDAFKRHAHGGKRFSSDEIIGLVDRFDEMVAAAIYLEDDLLRHQSPETRRIDQLIARSTNVVALQPRPVRTSPPGGGGDAA